jgi:hypothetical protein
MSYGYQIFGVSLTPVRRPGEKINFNNSMFGSKGARGYLADHVAALLAQGQGASDPRRGTYFRLDNGKTGGWTVVLEASGGAFGEQREVVDTTTHATSSTIGLNDAVLQSMTMILMIPPYGDTGFLVSETRGRSHLTSGLYEAMKVRTSARGLLMRLDRSISDEVAWNAYLNRTSVDIKSLELRQKTRSRDRTNFGNDRRVASATLSLRLRNDADTKRSLIDVIRPSAKSGKLAKVASVVGLENISDDDFDEQTVIYVENGRERRLNVTQNWPAFIYPINGTTAPTTEDVLDEALSDVAGICDDIGLDRSDDWWPSVEQLTPLVNSEGTDANIDV